MDRFTDPLQRLWHLYKEEARLSLTEKLTRLLSGIYIALIVLLLTIIGIVFVAIGIADELSQWLSPVTSYMIVGSGFILIAAVIIICRRLIIVDPIARYLSRLFLQPPKPSRHEHETMERL
jgi:hypothetical protein